MPTQFRLPTQALASFLFCLACVSHAGAQSPATRAPTDASRGVLSYADLLEPVLPAIVSVHVIGLETQKRPDLGSLEKYFGDRSAAAASEKKQAGAGFVIDAAGGLVVTASFVLDNAKSVSIGLHDGRMVDATIVGSDADSQIALLRIKPETLSALSWGDSASARVGDVVFAIGHPYALGRAVTAGIVSGISRDDERLNGREMIMTDATIARGYAGGPLIDSKGRVIGVAVAIFAGGNDLQLSFAVPSVEAQRVVKDLIAFGKVKRASLGVQLGDEAVDTDLEDGVQVNAQQLRIGEIVPGSSAERAGLKAGDVIVRAGGKPMRSASDLSSLVRASEVGAPLEITYRRDGAEHTVTATLGEAQP